MSNYIKVILVIVSLMMVVVVGCVIKDSIYVKEGIEFVNCMAYVLKIVVIRLVECVV